MPKKLLTVLAAMLAAAAFSVPTAAQALAPHWYINGTKVAEGEKVPVIEWGALTLEWEIPGPAPIVCEIDAGGFIENPVGGGAGRGQTTRFASWDCIENEPECPAGTLDGFEKELEVIWPPQDLPWPSELIASGPKVRLKSTHVVLELGCVLHGLTKAEAGEGGTKTATGEAGENEQKALGGPYFKCETTAKHLQDPEVHNGINAGPSQSTLIFNEVSGSGLICSDEIGSTVDQKLHFMGFDDSELITVK